MADYSAIAQDEGKMKKDSAITVAADIHGSFKFVHKSTMSMS